jgi:hypothetical protein
MNDAGESLEAYQQRHADFEQARIDCRALALGYGRVGERVLSLARDRAGMDDPSPSQAAAFDSLMAGAATVYRLFDGTGCPRP